MSIINGIGVQAGSSSIVGSDTLPSSPTFRQVYCTPSGMYVCFSDGSWSLLDSADAGTVSGSGVTNRLTKWTDGTGSVLGDSGVADDGTNILALRPFGTGFGLSTPAAFPTGARIAAASTVSTSPRGVQSMQLSADTTGAMVGLSKARGTVGTPVVVTTGDTLGQVMFRGFDGTGYLDMASITAASTGTIATNRVPTTLVFATATDAAPSVLTTALTIGADQNATFAGHVGIGVAPAANVILSVGGAVANQFASIVTGNATAGQSYGLKVNGGTNSSDTAFSIFEQTGTTNRFAVRGDGLITMANLAGTGTRAVFADNGGALSAPVNVTFPGTVAITGNTSLTTKITTYNNIATEGYGVGAIQKFPAITGNQSGAVTVTTITPTVSGSVYRVYGVFTTTSGTNTGTVGFTIDYLDTQATTHTADIIPVVGAAGAFATTGTAASKEFHTAPYLITVNSGTAITLKTVVTGTVQYTVTGFIEQVR